MDEDITQLSNALDSDDDMLKLSHLVHAFSHRLCRTLEEGKAACNRAPPEQGDGMLSFNGWYLSSDKLTLISIVISVNVSVFALL